MSWENAIKGHHALKKKKKNLWGTWVAQWVKHLTLDFSLGHDLRVRGFEPRVELCVNCTAPAWDSLCPSLSAPLLLA